MSEASQSRTAIPPEWQQTMRRYGESSSNISLRPIEESHRPSSGYEGGLPTGAGPRSSTPGLEDSDGLRLSRDRYRVGPMLGLGGMGVVMQAVQRPLNRSVAVKIARYDLGPEQRERFRQEAECTAWLEHPNIVPVYDAGLNYLVMKRIEGSDLEARLATGQLELSAVIEALIKICDAVSFAHHRGIIHRDIKPDNILVGRFGEVVLTDWGLAVTVHPPADGVLRAPRIGSGVSACAGTPGYLAPEVAQGRAADIGCATDVFLLGATLYRCLAGRPPFGGGIAIAALEQSLDNAWTPIAANPIRAPARLIRLQEAAMATGTAERPSVAAFQAGLRDWLQSCRSETEALRMLESARMHLLKAQELRLRPHAAYVDFCEAIAACDRALTLQPDLADAGILRQEAHGEFVLAALGAGEPQLARLLKQGIRLPAIPTTDPLVADDQGTPTSTMPAVTRTA